MASITERQRKDGTSAWQVSIRLPRQPKIIKSFESLDRAQEFATITEKHLRTDMAKFKISHERAKTYTDYEAEKLRAVISMFQSRSGAAMALSGIIPSLLRSVGSASVGDIKKSWLRDYIAKLRKSKTMGGSQYAWATIHKMISIMSMAVRWRAEDCDLPVKPFPFDCQSMFPKNWEVKRERRLATHEFIAIIRRVRQIDAPSSRFWRHLIRLAIETAARQQEIVLAQWSEVDLVRRVWTIPAARTKSKTSRAVPLSRKAVRIFKMLRLISDPNNPRVFHALGTCATVSALFHRYTLEAKVADFRFHDLRHEAISLMVLYKRQLSVYEIMTMVGHSSLEMLRRYTNLRTDELVHKMD
jgi:integrase